MTIKCLALRSVIWLPHPVYGEEKRKKGKEEKRKNEYGASTQFGEQIAVGHVMMF